MTQARVWTVRIGILEEAGMTKADAVLDTGDATYAGRGTAHRNPHDEDVPEIGDEIAVGRALEELGLKVLHAAEHELRAAGASPRQPMSTRAYGWPDVTM